ncbi:MULTISPECIES: MarR family winged helix-turn-helix transcriptional regulator [unclassified Kaistella]|uniref:MarR family winged helix-turn-helix transcriptional regulator n=1 Tax=unclassified Kaistella TaxID=2762626 RepID=UPI002734A6BE|nr:MULTISPECIES: MarR family winged helix-turn-helix transcriptional regulator [unclassified Kaistella]MCZ2083043.1 MarR family winged helix-turn-helix transcriptional regulator [Flavobacteriales bacterium]MDP2454110.1 MarR family winged helix-turn-helix transcriptional regulator [Kaistella sp. SH11-4b]MDP2457167.1 MarR family winged helix-turn-helix transcriptional regulator [Kaistella sp. SH40-3]MDP2459925.1 MarR family winged helix-turn-helix transcriptional regulator [Kaistella sp. SH19-2b]
MELNLIIDILTELDTFQKNQPSTQTSLEDFRLYLNEKAYDQETPRNLTDKFDLDVFDLENEIAKQVIMLGRYSKHLIKKSLENHPDLVNEDFTYLFRLMDYPSLTKMQLIEKNAHEKQSGIEIIKRLVRNGLFVESPDKDDKRSTRISVTEKGKKVFQESMKDITVVSKIMCGKLDDAEKESLLSSLKKLNTFHHTIYTNLRNEEPSELLKIVENA